jgi:hypothetical protein
MRPEGKYSIWYFIGILLLVYGVLIFATGIYEVFRPPAREVVLASLRPAIWWGALLIVVGAFYSIRFSPSRTRTSESLAGEKGHHAETEADNRSDRRESRVLS